MTWARPALAALLASVLLAAPAAAFPTAAGARWTPAGLASLANDLDAIAAREPLRSAHAGLTVVDAATNAALYARGANAPTTPASTLKLIVGLAALQRLGADFTFATSLEMTASPDAAGTVDGDVRLRGGGDPLLRSDDVVAAAHALANGGVRRINGCIQVDASHFDRRWYGAGWMLEDLGSAFSAPVSGFDLDENVETVEIAGGSAVGALATVLAPPDVTIGDNRIVTGPAGSEDTTDVAQRDDRSAIDLTGSVPLRATTTLSAAVPDPERRARRAFLAAVADAGIAADASSVCRGGSVAARPWGHRSIPLAQMLRTFWVRSDNLIGETLLKELGASPGTPASTAAGLRAEASFFRAGGIGAADASIVDGSGLSRYDIVPPRLLAALLVHAWNGPERAAVLDALPTAGVRGEFPGALGSPYFAGRLAAKTGSMTHVRGLAGYLATRRHGTVVFAWLVDDLTGDPGQLASAEAQALRRIVDAP